MENKNIQAFFTYVKREVESLFKYLTHPIFILQFYSYSSKRFIKTVCWYPSRCGLSEILSAYAPYHIRRKSCPCF